MTSDDTKKPFELNYADTGSDVDMDAQGVETIKREVQVNINFKLNDHTGFIRQHSKVFPLYAIAIGRPDNPNIKDTYYLQLSKEDLDYLITKHKVIKVHFTPCINASGAFGFNPRKVPFGNSRAHVSHITAHEIWEKAQEQWIKVSWNDRQWCFQYEEPIDKSIFPTDEELAEMWPTEDFSKMLSRGLKQEDVIITSLEATPIQRALGACK